MTLIIFNDTTKIPECQKNRDKIAAHAVHCLNYTHNFRECQKNLQKYQDFLAKCGIKHRRSSITALFDRSPRFYELSHCIDTLKNFSYFHSIDSFWGWISQLPKF